MQAVVKPLIPTRKPIEFIPLGVASCLNAYHAVESKRTFCGTHATPKGRSVKLGAQKAAPVYAGNIDLLSCNFACNFVNKLNR